MLVKIAPDVDDEQLDAIARVARESGVDGLIATNTTITRPDLAGEALARETGGLSGAPLAALAERTLTALRRRAGDDFTLIGVGGTDSAERGCARSAPGADQTGGASCRVRVVEYVVDLGVAASLKKNKK